MKLKKQIDDNLYEYNENFITGKQELIINGEVLEKTQKHSYKSKDGKVYKVDGNFFSGVTLECKKDKVVLHHNTWFENLLISLPMLLFIAGCFFGIDGGIIGGIVAFVCMFVCASVFHSNLKTWIKIVLSVLLFIIFAGLGVGTYLILHLI